MSGFMSEKVGIIGLGWVGKAQHELFPDAFVYDEPQLLEVHIRNRQAVLRAGRAAINMCDVSFICVPTPSTDSGVLDTSIVEEVVSWCESNVIVIRSTVNPGDSDRFKKRYDKRIVTQPEYLGETPNHPMLNPKERPFMVLGGDPEDRRRVIEAYHSAYNANISIRQVSNLEAEVIKLSENRAIMYKVMECQELYDVCEAAGVDYYTIRDAVYGDDPRFNLWFSFVYPDNRGTNSKCIPKDPLAWVAWAESVGVEPQIMKAMLAKNEDYMKQNEA